MTSATLTMAQTGAASYITARVLTTDECRSWLTTHSEGRLGYLSGRGPRHVVVAYAVSGDDIVVRVPDFNEIAQYVPGREVTLDVSGQAGEATVERVTVTGRAAVQVRTTDAVLRQLPDERWPDSLRNVVVSLPLQKLDGQVVGVRS